MPNTPPTPQPTATPGKLTPVLVRLTPEQVAWVRRFGNQAAYIRRLIDQDRRERRDEKP